MIAKDVVDDILLVERAIHERGQQRVALDLKFLNMVGCSGKLIVKKGEVVGVDMAWAFELADEALGALPFEGSLDRDVLGSIYLFDDLARFGNIEFVTQGSKRFVGITFSFQLATLRAFADKIREDPEHTARVQARTFKPALHIQSDN